MPRKQPHLFASTQEQEILLEDPLARRSIYLEFLLCIAIRKRVLVKLQLKEYIVDRLFEPTVVYLAKNHHLCVSGVQISDPEKPLINPQFRNFEIGEIRGVLLTEQAFVIDPVVDPFDARYANGIICSTY